MDRNIVIVGLDPGTTVGYAVLDLSGRILDIGSARGMSSGELIKTLQDSGQPVAFATDKMKVPAYVSAVAAKFNARVYHPSKDLAVADKKAILAGRVKGNTHELDALASALFAYREMRPLIEKIDTFVSRHDKGEIAHDLKRIILHKDNTMSIRAAVAFLEKPQVKKAIRQVTHDRDFAAAFFKAQKRIGKLSEQLRASRKKAEERPFAASKVAKTVPVDKKLADSLKFKDRKLNALGSEVRSLRKSIRSWEKKVNDLLGIVEHKEKYEVIWIINSHRDVELLKKGALAFLMNHGIARKTLDLLRVKTSVIISDSKISGFECINPKDLNIKILGKIAVAEKSQIRRQMARQDMLSRIISDYRKQ